MFFPAVSYPEPPSSGPLADPLVPPRCMRNPEECPIVCCPPYGRTTLPHLDDPGQDVPGITTDKTVKPASMGHNHSTYTYVTLAVCLHILS